MLMNYNKNSEGFIRTFMLIIIIGVLIIGTGGYFGIRQYQNYQTKKVEAEKQTQELAKLQQDRER